MGGFFSCQLSLAEMEKTGYKKVNKTIDTIQRDYDIVVNIVGDPIRLPQFGHDYPIMGTTDMSDYGKIEVATEFLWNIIPGPYDITYPFFIQNKARLEDNIRKNNLSSEKVQEYFNKVIEINKTYINDSETPDHVKAFKKYITLNKKTFGYAPKIVEEWRQFTIYIDVTHNFKEENYNSPDHDRGYLDNAGRIREYIIDWAKKHHKRY